MSGTPQQSNAVPPPSGGGPSDARTNRHEHLNTQRSLQEASVALETAFSRIRQVRRSLVQLSDSLPPMPDVVSARLNQEGIRPTHDALLLSGGAHDAMYADTFVSSALVPAFRTAPTFNNTMNHANGPRIHHPQRLAVNAPMQPSNHGPSTPFYPPPLPSVVPPRLTRHGVFVHPPPPGSVMDSAATTRGLRVAAREADPSLRDVVHDAGVDFASLTAEYERLLAQQRQFLDGTINLSNRLPSTIEEINRLPVSQNSVAARAQQVREAAGRSQGHLHGPPGVLPATPNLNPRADPRRARPPIPRQTIRSTIDPSTTLTERFATLADAYNQGYAPPDRQGMIQQRFQYDGTNVRLTPADPSSRTAPPRMRLPPLATSQTLSYGLIDDFDGEFEMMDDDIVSRLFPLHEYGLTSIRDPLDPDTVRITRTTDTSISPPEDFVPRRGWARLDPDGNEIPPDEEEELERSRTEYRLRALQQARRNPMIQSNPPMRHNARTIYGSVLDSTIGVPSQSHSHRLRHPPPPPIQPAPPAEYHHPFYVDPLPMPLASMVMTPKDSQDVCYPDIIVPKHACLAGR